MKKSVEQTLARLCSLHNHMVAADSDDRNRGTWRGSWGALVVNEAIDYILRAEEAREDMVGRLVFMSDAEAQKMEEADGWLLVRLYAPEIIPLGGRGENRLLFRIARLDRPEVWADDAGHRPRKVEYVVFGLDGILQDKAIYYE